MAALNDILDIFPRSFKLKSSGAVVGGVRVADIAQRTGTPAFIYCKETIEQAAEEYLRYFRARKFDARVYYASKALSSVGMLQLFDQLGLGVDVSTMGELQTAIKAGFTPQNIMFHGNNKSEDEIKAGIRYGIGRFVVDSFIEIERLKKHASKRHPVKVLLRVTPGIKASTHKYLTTGTADSKFAFLLSSENALKAVKDINASPELELTGFHFHIGSQIFELASYPKALERVVKWITEHKEVIDIEHPEINLGGGLGIKYTRVDRPPSIKEYCQYLVSESEKIFSKAGLKVSTLMIEPGRSLVGNAGFTLYTIGTVKVSGEKTFVSVDGGMSDNLRPALYGSKYEVLSIDKSARAARNCSLVGKHCETGDVLIENAALPDPEPGDLLAVPATGAYCYAMANNYNRVGRPVVILAGGGDLQVLISRETPEDVLRNDRPLKNGRSKVARTKRGAQ